MESILHTVYLPKHSSGAVSAFGCRKTGLRAAGRKRETSIYDLRLSPAGSLRLINVDLM